MARVYATLADLEAHHAGRPGWTPPAEPNAGRLLARASREVDRILTAIGAWYETDPVTLLPTHATVITALRDATCEQVGWWQETGDESGAAGIYQSVSIGSVQLSRGSGSGTAATSTRSAEAVGILRDAEGEHFRTGIYVGGGYGAYC
jgi:hypothetical protein